MENLPFNQTNNFVFIRALGAAQKVFFKKIFLLVISLAGNLISWQSTGRVDRYTCRSPHSLMHSSCTALRTDCASQNIHTPSTCTPSSPVLVPRFLSTSKIRYLLKVALPRNCHLLQKQTLHRTTTNEPLRLVQQVQGQRGLEAWHLIVRRYDQRNTSDRSSAYAALISNISERGRANDVEQFDDIPRNSINETNMHEGKFIRDEGKTWRTSS